MFRPGILQCVLKFTGSGSDDHWAGGTCVVIGADGVKLLRHFWEGKLMRFL